jgi:hypothetical protein
MNKATWLFLVLALLLGTTLIAACASSNSSSSGKNPLDDDNDMSDDDNDASPTDDDTSPTDDDDDDDNDDDNDDDDDDDTALGACCQEASCSVKPYGDCSGNWMGADTTCVPNPCTDDDDDNDDNDDDDNDDNDDNNDNDNDDEDTWSDVTTGLMWQNGPNVGASSVYWLDALTYCQDLVWATYSDWHTPSLTELRSLIRGCVGTQTGGACPATDSCASGKNCLTSACEGCTAFDGPGLQGLYWSANVSGWGNGYWTSTEDADWPYYAWYVDFDTAQIFLQIDEESVLGAHVRCVRQGSDDDDNDDDNDDNDTAEIWFDPTTGLLWQNGADVGSQYFNASAAETYCQNLTWGGLTGWTLPTIDDLRSFIRGCPSMETGGACGFTDNYTDCQPAVPYCYNNPNACANCGGCQNMQGPGQGGAYWSSDIPAVAGVIGSYWSATRECAQNGGTCQCIDDYYTAVNFNTAALEATHQAGDALIVRCVQSVGATHL